MESTDLAFFEVFPWNPNFDTGIPEIDFQHKRLVQLLNTLAAHLANKSDLEIVNRVLDELADYANYHFKTEEDIWRTTFGNEAWFSEHLQIHGGFMSSVTTLREELTTQSIDTVVGDLVKFLSNWLASHILDTDKRMSKVVMACKDGLSLVQAKIRAEQEMTGVMQALIEAILSMYAALTERALNLMRERVERKSVQEALIISEQRERSFTDALMASIPGLMFLIDEHNNLVRWNKGFVNITGYADEELAHMQALDFISEAGRPAVAEAIARVFTAGHAEVETEVVRKDGGSIPFYFSAARLDFEAHRYFGGIGMDITERVSSRKILAAHTAQLERSMKGTLEAIGKIVELRDPYTAGHERQVGDLAAAIGREMGWDADYCELLKMVGYVHDVGNIAVPAEVLVKPGIYSPLETRLVQAHVETGYQIMKDVDFPLPIADIILQHHERMDGSGYLKGLRGSEILYEARVIAVADTVEAMSSHRPFRPALGVTAALQELERYRGTWYDTEVVDATLRLFREKGYRLDG